MRFQSSNSHNSPPEKTRTAVHNSLISALTTAVIAWVLLTIVICVLSGLFWGESGLWGALLGAALGGVFFIISTCVSLFAITQVPLTMIMITLGAWLVKILLFTIILAVLAKKHFYSHPIFAMAVLCSIVFVLGSQIYAMRLKNIPIIDDTMETVE